MTYAELQRAFPKHPESFWRRNATDCAVAPRLPAEESQPLRRKTLDRKARVERSRQAGVAIIVTRCSSGRLDRDNLWASAKPLVDALRSAGYIPNDTEQDIELFVLQKKVPRKEAGTLIEIIPL